MKARYVLILIFLCTGLVTTAFAEATIAKYVGYLVQLPEPDGYKNIIKSSIGKSLASGYSTEMNKPLAFYIPETVNLDRGDKMDSYIVFTISRIPSQLESTTNQEFASVVTSIRSMAKRDNVKVLHESPTEIIIMSYMRDESVPYYKASSIFLVRNRILNFKYIQANTGSDDISRIARESIGWIKKIRKNNE